jgi:hypothetical protein
LADRYCGDSLVRDSQEPSGQFAETPYTISLQLWLTFITAYGNNALLLIIASIIYNSHDYKDYGLTLKKPMFAMTYRCPGLPMQQFNGLTLIKPIFVMTCRCPGLPMQRFIGEELVSVLGLIAAELSRILAFKFPVGRRFLAGSCDQDREAPLARWHQAVQDAPPSRATTHEILR